MGLSDEERLVKFYWRMTWMRHQLRSLSEQVSRPAHSYEHSEKKVSEWLAVVDDLSGAMVEQSDSSGLFWLLGSPTECFQSLWEDHYDLGRNTEDSDERPGHVFRKKVRDLSYLEAAQRWCHDDHEEGQILAAWWDVWGQVGAIFYPVYRYKDDLFAPIVSRLRSLVGEMVNNRFYLATPQHELQEGSYPRLAQLEQALLCRMKLFEKLAKPIEYGDQPTLAERKALDELRKMPQPGAAFAAFGMLRRSNPGYKDFHDLLDHVGALPLIEVRTELERFWTEEGERKHQPHKKDSSKLPRFGLLGPPPPSQESLETLIQDEDAPMVERRKAVRMLDEVYGIYWNPLPDEDP